MMKLASLFLLVLFQVANTEESSNEIAKNATHPKRGARGDYAIYSARDPSYVEVPTGYYKSEANPTSTSGTVESDVNPRGKKDPSRPITAPTSFDEYVPSGYYTSSVPVRPPRYFSGPKGGTMQKSGTSVNWNVWKGDIDDSADVSIDDIKGSPPPDYGYYYPSAWKGDPWTPEQLMTMMNQMTKPKPPGSGILAKITQEPLAFLMAAILPFTLLLAAVLPTLLNMMMNGMIPTITTTATGNNGRSLEGAEFLTPVVEAVAAFGYRSLDNPDCMQRIFCQVTKGPAGNGTESRSLQKALFKASTFIDGRWLDTFGVKKLFDSMADGDCDSIPCKPFKSSSRTDASDKGKQRSDVK